MIRSLSTLTAEDKIPTVFGPVISLARLMHLMHSLRSLIIVLKVRPMLKEGFNSNIERAHTHTHVVHMTRLQLFSAGL